MTGDAVLVVLAVVPVLAGANKVLSPDAADFRSICNCFYCATGLDSNHHLSQNN